MSELFNKEFTMMTDSTVDTLYFGALPSEGRYFVKKCERLSPGNFRVNVKVAKGDLYYHYRTSDDWSRVLLDPNNMQIGAKNWHSICRIGTTGFNTIEFDQTNSYISRLDNNQIEIKIVSHQEWIKAVDFVYVGSDGTKEIPMECTLDAKSRKYFKLIINLHDIPGNSYVFAVSCKNGDKLFYNANKQLTKEIVETFYDDFSRLPMYPAKSIGPVYQIFPDSFATSGDVNDCGRNVIKRSERPQSSAFYGGNIRGIIDKIDYIVNLGIKCVYLTPIFEANSNDRYDCIDYKSIDPMLGTKEDFKELCDLLHKHGIKLVLDIVLNHCGTDFWMFKDLLNKQEESEYRNYFEVTDYPVEFREYFPNYSSWWGNGKMPQFNLNNEEVVNYLFACCKYWIDEFGIDGWRIVIFHICGSGLVINGLAQYVKDTAQGLLTNGNGYGCACCDSIHTSYKSVRRTHSHAAYGVITQMLRNLYHQCSIVIPLDTDSFVDHGTLPVKLNVQHCTDDLCQSAFLFCCHTFFLPYNYLFLYFCQDPSLRSG